MIMTISGLPGSGKSTIAKLLATKLGYERHSTGDFQRQIVKEHGLSYEEYAKLYVKIPQLDDVVDSRIIKFGKEKDNFVMDSWMAGLFIPHSFKVFLKAELNTRTYRIFNDTTNKIRMDVEKGMSIEKTRKDIQLRDYANRQRWIEKYNFDYADESYYNLVIDTTDEEPEEIAKIILKKVKYWLKSFYESYNLINTLVDS